MKSEDVLEVLKKVYDPDYRTKSIVEMGLVGKDDIKVSDDGIEITYDLTEPMCPFSAAIGVMIKYAVEKKIDKPVRVKLKSHLQTGVVNEILANENKQREMLEKLEQFGILQQCIRVYGGKE